MSDAGQKIIEGLKEAVAGNFSRVTIEGQVWVKQDEPPIPDGAIRAHLYLDKCPSGLWFVTSKEWRGMYLAHRDLGTVLADVPNAGKGLLDAMRSWVDEGQEPLYGRDQLHQLAVYEQFFGDQPVTTTAL